MNQEPSDVGRVPWLNVVACAWMAIVGIVAIVDGIRLSHLTDQRRTDARPDFLNARIDAQARRVSDLEQQVDAIKQQPRPAAGADLEQLRHEVEDRLEQAEHARSSEVHADDIQAVQARVAVIEARMKRTVPSVPAPALKAIEAVAPKASEPPFSVVGLEMRGGERFLAVQSPSSKSLADVRLLREGEADGVWRVQAIEGDVVIFDVDGQTRRLAIP